MEKNLRIICDLSLSYEKNVTIYWLPLRKALNHANIIIEVESYSQLEYQLYRWWSQMTTLFVVSTVVIYSGVMKYVLNHVLKPH